jgi:hypothetical protein
VSEPYRLLIAAALAGDQVTLSLARNAAGVATAFDTRAPLLDRILGAVAGGVLSAEAAGPALSATPELRQAVLDLGQAQLGDLTVGPVAGRDVITVNVYVGAPHHDD